MVMGGSWKSHYLRNFQKAVFLFINLIVTKQVSISKTRRFGNLLGFSSIGNLFSDLQERKHLNAALRNRGGAGQVPFEAKKRGEKAFRGGRCLLVVIIGFRVSLEVHKNEY